METRITFDQALEDAGINPGQTLLIRHSLSDAAFKTCYEQGMVLEYTQCQRDDFGDGYPYWAVFISKPGTYAELYGIYENTGKVPISPDLTPDGFPFPEWFSKDISYFSLVKTDALKEYDGRLVIDWGPAVRTWHQRADKPKPIVSIRSGNAEGFERLNDN